MPRTKSKRTGGVKKHVNALDLPDERAYRAWCQQQGLGTGTHKSHKQRKKERALASRLKGERVMNAAKRQRRRPAEVVELIFAGKMRRADVKVAFLAQIWDEAERLQGDTTALEALRELVLDVRRRGKLDSGRAMWRCGNRVALPMARGLAALARHRADWLRPPAQ